MDEVNRNFIGIIYDDYYHASPLRRLGGTRLFTKSDAFDAFDAFDGS